MHAERIASENFAALLGTRLLESAPDRAVVELPYERKLGIGRIHGGAISALVDIAATAAFWTCPDLSAAARGATVGHRDRHIQANRLPRSWHSGRAGMCVGRKILQGLQSACSCGQLAATKTSCPRPCTTTSP